MKKLVQIRPAIILVILPVRIKVQVRAEGDVILRLAVPEDRRHRVHIQNTITEGNQPLVLIDLVHKLLVEKQLAALVHHALLEARLLQLHDKIRVGLLLLFRRTGLALRRIVTLALTSTLGQNTQLAIHLQHKAAILLHHIARQASL